MDLSVVIPVYNEKMNLRPLNKKLVKVLEKLNKSYEIIFVNDGSGDGSREVLNDLAEEKNIKVIHFRKNFGQTPAMQAGFDHAKGEVIVPIDADLQNDPEDITKLLEKMNKEGLDVVSGWRKDREDPFSKRIFSKFSNWLASKLMGLNLHDFGCTLKAYRKEALKDIRLFGEMHRFIPALCNMNGYSVGEMEVRHHKRYKGETKYSLGRLFKGLLDLFYIKFWSSYSTRPLHLFGLFGIILMIAGFITSGYDVLFMSLYLGNTLKLGPLLMLSVLFLILGVQFIVFGFLAEIDIRNYYESSGEKDYKVEKIRE